MLILQSEDKNFLEQYTEFRSKAAAMAADVEPVVKNIISSVKQEGDTALQRFTEQFDGHGNIPVSTDEIQSAKDTVPADIMDALQEAFKRIETFHRKQLQNSWIQTEPTGEILGQVVRPLERVGLYVPGGKAVYPSSVLMNAIPALVAGVEEIIMVTPGSRDGIEPVILAAAEMCSIQKVFQVGGAQAVAALSYGTDTVPRVDKIVGPGNIYVATAKKLVFGDVDIDMIAGPSEILIVSDGTGDPEWVAADMLSQAEHDEMASSIVVTTSAAFAEQVEKAVQAQLADLPKREIAEKSINDNGAVIIVKTLEDAARISNDIAPEHLELFVADPWGLLPSIKNAGAIFLGYHTPEPVGDYIAGPNHVLPTGGTARFFSPLSVDDFIKKSSLLSFPQSALQKVGTNVMKLAGYEQLEAHARSVKKRLQ